MYEGDGPRYYCHLSLVSYGPRQIVSASADNQVLGEHESFLTELDVKADGGKSISVCVELSSSQIMHVTA
jgi:hypothetical protein